MYFIYMALDFARTPNTKNYGPSQGPKFMEKFKKKIWFVFRCVADYEGTFACVGSFY